MMAVTDLTDSLPWWARQGQGPSGGPGAAPQGGGVGGQPPPGVDQQSWLNYLMQMFSPASANAAEPDINSILNHGGTTPVNNSINANVVPPAAPAPGTMPARPATGMGIQPGGLSSRALGAFNNMPWPSGGGSINPTAPAPAGQAAPGSAPVPVAAPVATGGAGGVGATSNPRFVGLDYRPNASPQNSMRAGPQATALNLAGLFGGGQPAAAAPAAAPRVAGPMALNGPIAGWNVDARGAPYPSDGDYAGWNADARGAPYPTDAQKKKLAAASLKQRYG
jgi:hypothetical protein